MTLILWVVVAFDESALWAHRLQQLVDLSTLQSAIGGISANGQTNIFAGLSQAEEVLVAADARIKHIILLTDGWSQAGDYDAMTARFCRRGDYVVSGGGRRWFGRLSRQSR